MIEKRSRDGMRVIVGEKGLSINIPAGRWEGRLRDLASYWENYVHKYS